MGARVGGTDAGELVAAGKIKLEPAKAFEKKSDLMKKINTDASKDEKTAKNGEKAQDKAPADKNTKVAQSKNGEAYQVMFDAGQKMKMQKPSTAFSKSKLPPIVMKQQNAQVHTKDVLLNKVSQKKCPFVRRKALIQRDIFLGHLLNVMYIALYM